MAKESVTVDNKLEEVKLVSHDELETKTKKGKVKKEKAKKGKGYISQVTAEMKLVTWPTKKNLVKYSLTTILMVVLLSAFFVGVSALFDLLYALVQGWIG